MINSLQKLIEAENYAATLFKAIEDRGLIIAGKTEKQLNTEIYNLAFDLFKINKYWHKRIVRAGKNTLLPYQENPPDLTIQQNDIIFFDFGPVFDEWEADFGRTFVLGNNTHMIQLKDDTAKAWHEGKLFYEKNKSHLTGADFYQYTKELAIKYSWEYGNHHCGHLIGNFPHEIISGEETINYIHPDNQQLMSEKDKHGNERFWIYEIHFIDKSLEIGGFFEQLIS